MRVVLFSLFAAVGMLATLAAGIGLVCCVSEAVGYATGEVSGTFHLWEYINNTALVATGAILSLGFAFAIEPKP